jgi:uncharacterized membrane protein YedE/YeeE
MVAIDPASALLGGALIGIASVLLMATVVLPQLVSGILGGALAVVTGDKLWRFAFIAGLVSAPILVGLLSEPLPEPPMAISWLLIVISGLLVGFGARLGGGCTSGHGVCGIARLSRRSIAATAIFMATAAITVAIVRHGLGG